jgi:hypothetical protein
MLRSDSLSNPVDLAELVVMDRDLAFDRLDDGELVADVTGQWGSYRVWFSWQEDAVSERCGALMLTCSFETRMPTQSATKVNALLALVNEKLWVGHFIIDPEDKSVRFRHSLLIRDGNGTSQQQLQDLLDMAIQECERFFPAFQSVVWGGKSPAEALEMALFETIAEA